MFTLPYVLAYRNCIFPSSPSGSSGSRLQCSLPECRLYSTAALASDEQAGPDISLLSPLLQSQWDHPRNAHLGTIVIKPQSNIKVWWACTQCPDGHTHKWLAPPNNRSSSKNRQGTGCPFCANRKVCQHNSLHTKAPHLLPEWSEANERSPHDFTVSSGQKAWWRCKCGCEWEATINHRTSLGTGCPDCAAVRTASKTRHPTLTERQHDMMHNWDWEANAEAGLDPSKLRCRSHKKAHWVCHQCPVGQPHRWQAAVGSMYRYLSRGTSGCPCCEGRQACKCNSLQSLFPEVAAEWDHQHNIGTPADYAAQSNKKVWWYDSRRGRSKAVIQSRTQTYKQQTGQVRCACQPSDVSPMWPACATVQLAALASPAVSTNGWQPWNNVANVQGKLSASH